MIVVSPFCPNNNITGANLLLFRRGTGHRLVLYIIRQRFMSYTHNLAGSIARSWKLHFSGFFLSLPAHWLHESSAYIRIPPFSLHCHTTLETFCSTLSNVFELDPCSLLNSVIRHCVRFCNMVLRSLILLIPHDSHSCTRHPCFIPIQNSRYNNCLINSCHCFHRHSFSPPCNFEVPFYLLPFLHRTASFFIQLSTFKNVCTQVSEIIFLI